MVLGAATLMVLAGGEEGTRPQAGLRREFILFTILLIPFTHGTDNGTF